MYLIKIMILKFKFATNCLIIEWPCVHNLKLQASPNCLIFIIQSQRPMIYQCQGNFELK